MAWTTPRTWVAGETVTAALMNTHVRDNLKAVGDAWLTYTPVWSATGTAPALGNGSITGRYRDSGKTHHFYISLSIGSTTTLGTGRWDFTLPATPIGYVDLAQPMGMFIARDAGVRNYECNAMFTSPNKVHGWRDAGATEATVTPTTPFAWGSGDALFMLGTYEAA